MAAFVRLALTSSRLAVSVLREHAATVERRCVVMPRRVVCPCSAVSESMTDEQRRAFGWRLVPASLDPESSPHARNVPAADVFVWVCAACASLRSALLRAS